MVRIGQIGRRQYSTLAGNELYKGHMKLRRAFVTRLSIVGMGDTSTFVIKGDACAFVMGEGMGDMPVFIIKRTRTSRNTCLLCFHNQRRALRTHISRLSEKRVRLRY
jgi:hypothetical protein